MRGWWEQAVLVLMPVLVLVLMPVLVLVLVLMLVLVRAVRAVRVLERCRDMCLYRTHGTMNGTRGWIWASYPWTTLAQQGLMPMLIPLQALLPLLRLTMEWHAQLGAM